MAECRNSVPLLQPKERGENASSGTDGIKARPVRTRLVTGGHNEVLPQPAGVLGDVPVSDSGRQLMSATLLTRVDSANTSPRAIVGMCTLRKNSNISGKYLQIPLA